MADISLQYLDQPLNNVSVGYKNDDFFGERIFPIVPVKKQSGRYWIFAKEKFRPALGYTFRWLFGAPDLGGTLTKRYRDEKRTSDVIEVHRYDDIELTAPLAGGIWQSVVN
jgi:hypothetical protein